METHSKYYTNEFFGVDSGTRRKAHEALEKAKALELNKRRTVPKRISDNLTVYITPEQDNDPAFMKKFQKRLEKR